MTLIERIKQQWGAWQAARKAQQIERLKKQIQQQAWRNSLAERTQQADLAAGYNMAHFNTMQ